jgi:sugar lactone lactonase YvrE
VPEEQVLYWADIENSRVFRYRPGDGDLKTYELDIPLTALGRRASGGWVAAAKTGLYFWDPEKNATAFISDPEADTRNVRFNDGAVDSQGRFLIGSINEKELTAPDGSLFRLDADGSAHKIDSGLAVANGIAQSPDGRTLYVTDMFNSRILAYDYDVEAGVVANRRVFAQVPTEAGWPDGLIADSEGFLWSAHWAGWRITRYDPAGKIEREIRMPVANPTCFAFGGEKLDQLYITTAWFMLSEEERAAQPLAGDLFLLQPGVTGLPEPSFAG